ncbi:MAG TPA: TIGR04282 family arsenosugar biosynthesis glycosyltransferase [Candidatus Nanoarchaeia archaeon]|nr:TIGR04282 family arsenosugar biosynthesis glycosyltransferase [Candidatus Nanoarchaeia archaeon]
MDALVVFSKYPETGKVKTKLGLHIGFKKSRDLCHAFLMDLLKENKNHHYRTILACAPKDKLKAFKKRYKADAYILQQGKNIGKRARNAFKTLLKKYERVVAIGSDVPGLPHKVICDAFSSLNKTDVVLGPAVDGSYYLVGMSKPYDLFTKLKGYYPEVLSDTIHLIKKKKLSYALLKKINDIDDIESLRELKRKLKKEQAPKTYALINKLKF